MVLRATFEFPPVEHKLVVGLMKHWYLLKDGTPKYQTKVLERRDPTRQLLAYALLFNTFDGTSHTEVFLAEEQQWLRGFLARAWGGPKWHPLMLSGVPEVLYVPADVKNYFYDLDALESARRELGVQLLPASKASISGAPYVRLLYTTWKSKIYDLKFRSLTRNSLPGVSGFVSAHMSHRGFYSPKTRRFEEYVLFHAGPRSRDKTQPSRPLNAKWEQDAFDEFDPPLSSWVETVWMPYFPESPSDIK